MRSQREVRCETRRVCELEPATATLVLPSGNAMTLVLPSGNTMTLRARF